MARKLQIENLSELKQEMLRLERDMRNQELYLKHESYQLLEHVPGRVLERSLSPLAHRPGVVEIKNPIGKLLSGIANKVFHKQGFFKRLGISIAAKKIGAALEKKLIKETETQKIG
ncbi:hypothetical protein [Pedobacter sp. SYP-B3415]|uniref:hypothetical protein n=1 Tax=Pedobacter sp. SYP-B3415 TaxID=2496641 RepID=UPI00101D449C|nr:hypothetical protein [Pedobacter sp. SYP-B3415]